MYSRIVRSRKVKYTIRRNYGTKTTNMFLPNEQRHQFDSEKLTPEENKAAIPKKPNFDHLPKYHHDIASPESIADLVVRPHFNDIFVTSLAKDSPFSGDSNYTLISKDPSKSAEAVKLYFTTMTCKWIEVFNEQIYGLSDLPVVDESLDYVNKSVVEIISRRYNELDKDSLYTFERLEEFYKSLNGFRNSERKVKGQLQQTELSNLITVENISSFLLNVEETKTNPENFDTLLSIIEAHIEIFTVEGLKELLSLLVNNLHDSKLSSIQMKLASFNNLVNNTLFELYPTIISELNPRILDKLAFLLTISSNISKAKEVLYFLVQNHKISPSIETFNTFISHYEKTLINVDRKETILRDLADLKSVFFHNGITSISFNVLLNNAINNVYDLDHFLSLVEQCKNGKNLLNKYSKEIIKKLQLIQSNSTDLNNIRSLQLSQVIRRLVVVNKITLNEETLEIAKEIYAKLNENDNVKQLQSLKS